MHSTKVSIPGLNLGDVVTEKTTLPGFLDGLGQLLVLLHTDPCVWGMKDDTRVCTDKLFQELHILQERDKQMCEGLVKTSVG